MARVTTKILENQVDTLNRLYGYSSTTEKKFFLSGAYGGWKLVLKYNDGGMESNISDNYISKTFLSSMLTALINVYGKTK